MTVRCLSTLVIALLSATIVLAQRCESHQAPSFPGKQWVVINPQAASWSSKRLAAAKTYFESLPPASVVLVDQGRIVAQWGDPTRRIKVSSIRKSLLSALYGIYSNSKVIDLDASLKDVGLDDDPPLTDLERTATLRMLLKSRSGIFHAYVAGTPDMRMGAPVRGSHAPDSYWYYNNWDFNALGTAFEHLTHEPIASAFQKRIAVPIGMQDFTPNDMYYVRAMESASLAERSLHPAYHFRLSARDLARFGYLYLQGGRWRGRQIVPCAWVAESTHSFSDAGNGEGYGYLWWINGWNLDVDSFSARGALAKRLIVVPSRRLVIVYLNHAEVPDDTTAMSAETLSQMPHPSADQQQRLLQLILAAQR